MYYPASQCRFHLWQLWIPLQICTDTFNLNLELKLVLIFNYPITKSPIYPISPLPLFLCVSKVYHFPFPEIIFTKI
jgi:hypothetical protein